MATIDLFPTAEFNPEMIAFMNANWRMIQDLLNGHLTTSNLDTAAIATVNLADGSVTQIKAADGVAKIFSADYTGTGVANREINVGYRLRYVKILKHDDSKIFESIGTNLIDLATWWRDSAGAVGTGTAQWQGVSANGFKCGTDAAGGTSNLVGVTYSYVGWR